MKMFFSPRIYPLGHINNEMDVVEQACIPTQSGGRQRQCSGRRLGSWAWTTKQDPVSKAQNMSWLIKCSNEIWVRSWILLSCGCDRKPTLRLPKLSSVPLFLNQAAFLPYCWCWDPEQRTSKPEYCEHLRNWKQYGLVGGGGGAARRLPPFLTKSLTGKSPFH